MDDLVSVIVPIYNVEPYLHQCVDSIRQQTYRNLEIILIDDGSPDHCGKICDQFAASDDRFQVIHQENKGLSEARNKGIEICNGSYVLLVDGDDYIEPNTVECLLRASIDTRSDVTCCGYYRENGRRCTAHALSDKVKSYAGADKVIAAMNDTEFGIFAWNKLWRRQLFDAECRFPPGRYFRTFRPIGRSYGNVTELPACRTCFFIIVCAGTASATQRQ